MAEFRDVILNLCRNQVDLSARQLGLAIVCSMAEAPSDRRANVIAAALNVAKPVITRAADRLEEAGLLQRDKVKEDRRLCVLTLTKKGIAFVKAMNDGGAKARLG